MPTLTKYPNLSTGTAPIDGWVQRNISPAEDWTTIRNGAGTEATPAGDFIFAQYYNDGSAFGQFLKGMIGFDTSDGGTNPLVDKTISSAVVYGYGTGKQTATGWTMDTVLTGFTPDDPTTLGTGDYNNVTDTIYSDVISYDNFTISAYNAYSLGEAGINYINRTGNTWFGFRNYSHDVLNVAPPNISGGGVTQVVIYSVDGALGQNFPAPYLEIVYIDAPYLSAYIDPESDVTKGWSRSAGSDNFELVDDGLDTGIRQPTAADTTDYIYTVGGDPMVLDEYNCTTVDIQEGILVTLRVWAYAQKNAGNPAGIQVSFWDGVAWSEYKNVNEGNTWGWKSLEWSGLSLTQAQVDAIKFRVRCSYTGAEVGQYQLAEIYGELIYSANLAADLWQVTKTVNYTKGDYVALPSDDTDLETAYSTQEVTDVATANNVYVDQSATSEFTSHQFKNYAGTKPYVTITCECQTNESPTLSTVYLQIYNRITPGWDTIDSDNSSAVDTDFTLTATITDLTNYKDADNMISCRVYQEDL